jgi:RimJ/RimL family protein N-acetyltransferase
VIPAEPFVLPAGPVVLRPWRQDDLDAAWAALQDRDTRRWNGDGGASRQDAAALIRRRSDWSGGRHASWAVAEPDGTFLGSVSLHSIDAEEGTAEIGYWIAPDARGRGLAAIAVDAACRWAFAAVPLARIALVHDVANVASARVAERAGFRREGILRSSARAVDGERVDEVLWARLDSDPVPPLPI